ncbi:MAG: RidA family protein [Candidatus Dormibacteraeota bacterium]|nr:RidA family protein [Candidatus Dormibacteraeota bacterium]
MPAPAPIPTTSTPEQVLSGLTLTLPPAYPEDLSNVRRVGHILYTPGVLPRWGEEIRHVGRVGEEVPVRTAARAAQLCVHNIIALVRVELGSLDRIQQVMTINVLVRSAEGFENPGRVADGASQALYQIFGVHGRHHRTVLPTTELPHDASVQVSAIFRAA